MEAVLTYQILAHRLSLEPVIDWFAQELRLSSTGVISQGGMSVPI